MLFNVQQTFVGLLMLDSRLCKVLKVEDRRLSNIVPSLQHLFGGEPQTCCGFLDHDSMSTMQDIKLSSTWDVAYLCHELGSGASLVWLQVHHVNPHNSNELRSWYQRCSPFPHHNPVLSKQS
jgi:hypothetical protein